ncbi:ATP-binding cassette domain-containing protein [Paenibacillus sp. CC-CFT742]|nr:ATP-binding cassette domain-containing protein [Paenibacillus sp. CC-CFT742]WJH31954.1 ATP-binding cassette domain-containing protein [Paenibacillus sp. CC-CFT742]
MHAALQSINLKLYPGECLGIVGESGSGKSTLAKCVTHLEKATSGQIIYRQQDITWIRGEALRQQRKQIQMVFQEPSAIFNPRMRVGSFILEPLLNYKLIKRRQGKRKFIVCWSWWDCLLPLLTSIHTKSVVGSSSEWLLPGRSECSRM